jgi:hypothetical protein
MKPVSTAAAFEWKGERIYLDRCPLSSITRETDEALRFYPWLESGTWPVPGGLLAQSSTFVHAIEIFASEKGRIERARMKKEAEKHGR